MRLVLFTFPVAIALGFAVGGRLRNLGTTPFRHGWAGIAGIALQFVPVGGAAGYLVLSASFVLLLFVASSNWRLPGFLLVLVGLSLNFLVIVVNEGMPVTREAIVASGQAHTLGELEEATSAKHHLATQDDELLFLGDRIAIPAPVEQAVSVGDVVAYVGAMWFVVAGMRSPGREDPGRDLEPAGASA